MRKIEQYIKTWEQCGYSDGIPDEVPHELARLNLAPSYKAIAVAILSNDLGFNSLGFPNKVTAWYSVFKKIEIDARGGESQGCLFN